MKPPTTIAAMTTNALCHGFCERPRVSMSLPPLRLFSHPYVTLPVTSLCRLVVRLTLRPANQAHSPDLARR
jgi:hypothetical protein